MPGNTTDGIHLSDRGQVALANFVWEIARDAFLPRSAPTSTPSAPPP